MGRAWKRRLAVGFVCGCVALLAPRAAAWFQRGAPPEVYEADDQPFLEAALRDEEVLRPDLRLDPREVVSIPVDAKLSAAHAETFPTPVQYLNRCRDGDALVTVERPREGISWVVVHRGGKPCFRLTFPDGPDQSPAALQLHGTIDVAGSAGPLAVVHTHPLQPLIGEGGLVVKREAIHFVVVGHDGRILLERGIETSAPSLGRRWGAAVSAVPLVWDGASLVAWASARRWEGIAAQCLGSLLRMGARGPIAVAEGVPCEPVRAEDADGDGTVELVGATRAMDGVPWEAVVDLAGDFLSTRAREEESRTAPELHCPVGAERCVQGDVGVLASVAGAERSFDWTGDGGADLALVGPGAAAGTWQVILAEGDLTFAWPADAGWILPRHQAPRALSLSGRAGPEVLIETGQGFEVRAVPGAEVRWTGLSAKGVVDAWALPASGASTIAPRRGHSPRGASPWTGTRPNFEPLLCACSPPEQGGGDP